MIKPPEKHFYKLLSRKELEAGGLGLGEELGVLAFEEARGRTRLRGCANGPWVGISMPPICNGAARHSSSGAGGCNVGGTGGCVP